MSRMCWFTLSWATEIEAIAPYAHLSASTYLHFILCPSDARAAARNLSTTPHPNFIDMRGAFGTKISLRLCSFFFCVHNRSPLAQGISTEP